MLSNIWNKAVILLQIGLGVVYNQYIRCMKNNQFYVPVKDGEDIIFANTCVNDGSDKSELLQLMLNKEAFYNEKFPQISNAINYFKETEGGQSEMCKVVEDYAKEYAKSSIQEAIEAKKLADEAKKYADSTIERNNRLIVNILAGRSYEEAALMLGISVEEVKQAEAALTTIFKALFPSIKTKNKINGKPMLPALFSGTKSTNKANKTFHAIQAHDQTIITFLLPCLPASFAPINAKIILGSIAITEIIEEPTMLPNKTLNNNVEITDCLYLIF